MMKRLLFAVFAACWCGCASAQMYYSDRYFDTYSFGMGYSLFDESHGGDYTYKGHQVELYGIIHGIYVDASFAPEQYSSGDDEYLATWGMNFGYTVPLMKKIPRYPFRAYVTPVVGFKRVGYWYDKEYYGVDIYGPFRGEDTGFHAYSKYWNAGFVVSLSYKRLFISGKISRMENGVSLGVNL